MTPLVWGIFAVLVCAIATIECAIVSARKDPRLFTSMIFFALNWAVLLPYYALQPFLEKWKELGEVAEFLPAYSAVLLLLTSEPLWREVTARSKPLVQSGQAKPSEIGLINVFSLRGLYLLVLPHVIPFVKEEPGQRQQVMIGLQTIFSLAGFFLIVWTLEMLTRRVRRGWRRKVWWGFLLVALIYAVAGTSWAVKGILQPGSRVPDDFVIAFAISKVLFSALFLVLVVSETASVRGRDEVA